jgi:hypothetical protein
MLNYLEGEGNLKGIAPKVAVSAKIFPVRKEGIFHIDRSMSFYQASVEKHLNAGIHGRSFQACGLNS